MIELWSYILTIISVVCFFLAGRKVWWAWYIGIVGQFIWFAYSISTDQWGFVIGSIFFTIIYIDNSIKWTEEHMQKERNK